MSERIRDVKLCGGHSGQERWCAEWNYWAPKPPQVMSPLHLHSFLYHLSSTVVLPSRVVPAVVNPTMHNSNNGLQQFKYKSITISTPGPVGLNHRLWHHRELAPTLTRSKMLLLWEFWNHGYQNFKIFPQQTPPWSLWTRQGVALQWALPLAPAWAWLYPQNSAP